MRSLQDPDERVQVAMDVSHGDDALPVALWGTRLNQ
jgi:hypothetical protein